MSERPIEPHSPGAGHEPPRNTPSPADSVSSALAIAQFVFTGVVVVVVAGLMYTAGLRSGKGHGGGEGGPAAPAAQGAPVDVEALMQPTPEHIAAGKSLFAINCASCHGTAGHGDGPAASALNPKPRDFTAGYWRYGGGTARVVQTITVGSPGTAMAPFPGIPLADRFALAHYVRSFSAKQEADKPEDLAWLDQFGGRKGSAPAGEGTAAVPAGGAPGDTIPIERAMALLVERTAEPPLLAMPPDSSTGEGARIYAMRCASCHGTSGEGGVRTRMLGSAPYAYVSTRSLSTASPMAGDAGSFERLVLRGLPGTMMPGNGDLTSEQIRALYTHTQSLRARLENAARARS